MATVQPAGDVPVSKVIFYAFCDSCVCSFFQTVRAVGHCNHYCILMHEPTKYSVTLLAYSQSILWSTDGHRKQKPSSSITTIILLRFLSQSYFVMLSDSVSMIKKVIIFQDYRGFSPLYLTSFIFVPRTQTLSKSLLLFYPLCTYQAY